MSTQIVQHKSREASFTLNFSATENNLIWSFTAENDGEIYDVVLNNIASYTIAGAATALPYALSGATSYTVSIVKTMNGQAASITFKTRRALNKSSNISVPDFGDNSINKMFLISRDGYVYVVQKEKINGQNYLGDGFYTENPLAQTIVLPALPNYENWGWSNIFYDDGYMICIGMENKRDNSRNVHVCRINITTYEITDLDNTQNTTTIIRDNISEINLTQLSHWGCYDFVNRKYFFTRNVSIALFLDLNNKIIDRSIFQGTVYPSGGLTGRFFVSYYDYINNLVMTRHVGGSAEYSSRAIPVVQDNYVFHSRHMAGIKTSSYWGRLAFYNQNGVGVAYTGFTDTGGNPAAMTGVLDLFFMFDNTRVRIQGFSQYSQNAILNLHPTQTLMVQGLPFDENGTLFCTISDSGRLHLFLYDEMANTVNQQFLDLNNGTINCMAYDNNLIC